MKLRDLAERLRCRLEGDGNVEIRRVAGIERAGPGDLTFVANPRYASLLGSTRASAIILGAGYDGALLIPAYFVPIFIMLHVVALAQARRAAKHAVV